MLCEKCHKKEANISVKTMINGVSESHNLCRECAQKAGVFQTGFAFDSMPMSNYIGQALFNFPINKTSGFKTGTGSGSETNLKCDSCDETLKDFKQTGLFGCSDCYHTFRNLIRPILDQIQGSHMHFDDKRETLIEDNTENEKKGIIIEKSADVENRDAIEPKSETTKDDQSLSEIALFRQELRELIKEEKYEEAAVVRDKIKDLSKLDQASEDSSDSSENRE